MNKQGQYEWLVIAEGNSDIAVYNRDGIGRRAYATPYHHGWDGGDGRRDGDGRGAAKVFIAQRQRQGQRQPQR